MTVVPTALCKTCSKCGGSYSYDEVHSCGEGNRKLPIEEIPLVMPETLVGATLGGRYHIQEFLEKGGMGTVFRALHVTLLRSVAIKILVLRERGDTAAQQRFFQEAVLASRVRHPNIIDIFDFGMLEGGALYLVMELLEGCTLHQALREGPLPPWWACLIAAQIARGLQAVHDQGIVHRDLKPDNVFLLQRDGHGDFVKIVDFGIAKARSSPALTQPHMLIGTPLYMAPEQISGDALDARVDQYALGCVLYRMLTDTLPFDSPNTGELLSMHVHAPVPLLRERRPDLRIPASLEAVVLRLMAKRAEDRFPSMREVAEVLSWEMERLEDRPRDRRGQAEPGPWSSGPLAAVSGPERGGGAVAQQVLGVLEAGQGVGGPTRLLLAPGLAGEPRRRSLLVPAALGVGVGGVMLCLVVVLGHRSPQPAATHPMLTVQAAGADLAAEAAGVHGPAPRSGVEDALASGAVPGAPDQDSLLTHLPGEQGQSDAPEPAPPLAPPPPSGAPPQPPDPRPAEGTVRFKITPPDLPVLVRCGRQPAAPCKGWCLVLLPQGPGECVISAPGSGFRPASYALSALRALPRQRGIPVQPVQLSYIRP